MDSLDLAQSVHNSVAVLGSILGSFSVTILL